MRHKVNMLAIVAMARFIPPSHCDLLIHQVDISLMEKPVIETFKVSPTPKFKIRGYYKKPKIKKFKK